MIVRNGKTTHLIGRDISYIMFENEDGDLLNFHFGKKIADIDYSQMKEEWEEKWGFVSNRFCLDNYPQEYPSYGYSDLRNPAYQVVNKFGNAVSRLAVKDYIIHNECAVQTDGMPCLFNKNKKADTLEVVLYDEIIDLEVHLYYTVFDEYNIIARHTVIINKSDSDIKLLSAYSASIDLPMDDYEMIHFAGSWGRERAMHRTKLEMGMKAEVENARGGSGHQLNPFSMITSVGTDETHGEVYGFSLVYSGNHSTVAKIDQFGNLRVQQGINPHQFEWILKPNESFCTPQSIICYSDSGIGTMTREYHDVFRNNLMRSKWVNKKRPILINNWEGTYFDFYRRKVASNG